MASVTIGFGLRKKQVEEQERFKALLKKKMKFNLMSELFLQIDNAY